MASCGYSCFVGGYCGPSSFNLANVQCVSIGDCKKDVRSHLVYCKISDNSGVDIETKLLLARAGRFLAIANPSCKSIIRTRFADHEDACTSRLAYVFHIVLTLIHHSIAGLCERNRKERESGDLLSTLRQRKSPSHMPRVPRVSTP